jgi:hypothetical protein
MTRMFNAINEEMYIAEWIQRRCKQLTELKENTNKQLNEVKKIMQGIKH